MKKYSLPLWLPLAILFVIGFLGFVIPIWADALVRLGKLGITESWAGFAGSIISAFITIPATLGGAALAWFAVQQQINNTNDQLRASERLRQEDRISTAANEIRSLNAARNYLTIFVNKFPQPNSVKFIDFDFARHLLKLYERAHVYVSESASAAPGPFGVRVLTEMWRIRTLAENVKDRKENTTLDFRDLSAEIKECVSAIWRIADDIKGEIKERERRYAELTEQFARLNR